MPFFIASQCDKLLDFKNFANLIDKKGKLFYFAIIISDVAHISM